LQVKLLRVLQEREFEPVGSNETRKVDVRVIMATNVDLDVEVEQGRFRQDLYYRINVVTVQLPTLEERIGDIPLLAQSFLKRYGVEAGKRINGFTEEALRCLQRYHWPGNVRELENAVERAVVLGKGSSIDVDDLPPKLLKATESGGGDPSAGEQPQSLRAALEAPERRVIEAALRRNEWCRQSTADELEINRTTLYKKMKRYGLDADPARRSVGQPVGEV
jgi:DNA-binding NtrC family response regulator